MVTFDEVRRITLALPETSENGGKLRVRDKALAWARPMRAGDPDDPQTGRPYENVLGVRVADEGVKQSLLATNPQMYFTIPHFDGYPAVLVRMDQADPAELAELIEEAWLLRAPKRLVKHYLAGGG